MNRTALPTRPGTLTVNARVRFVDAELNARNGVGIVRRVDGEFVEVDVAGGRDWFAVGMLVRA